MEETQLKTTPRRETKIDLNRSRLRNYLVSAEDIMTLLGNWRFYDHAGLPIVELPEGFEIVGVWWEFSFNKFAVTVWHETFDVVRPGYRIPESPNPIGFSHESFVVPMESRLDGKRPSLAPPSPAEGKAQP